MIGLYSGGDTLKSHLDTGIKDRVANFTYYEECKPPDELTPIDSIIVLGKKKNFFGLNFDKSIDFNDDIYVKLASHNFRIFIEEILKWNPFLNYSPSKKKIESGWQGHSISYNGLEIFNSEGWWNQQQWWTEYKEKLLKPPDVTPPSPLSPPQPSPLPTAPATIESLQAEIARLKNVIDKYKNILHMYEITDPLLY